MDTKQEKIKEEDQEMVERLEEIDDDVYGPISFPPVFESSSSSCDSDPDLDLPDLPSLSSIFGDESEEEKRETRGYNTRGVKSREEVIESSNGQEEDEPLPGPSRVLLTRYNTRSRSGPSEGCATHSTLSKSRFNSTLN
jgi:hypothetical protein